MDRPCLVSDTVGCRLVSSIAFDEALPDWNWPARLPRMPSKNPIPYPLIRTEAGRPGGSVGTRAAPQWSVPHYRRGHASAAEPSSSSFLLRRTEDQKEPAISTTPTRPVMISLISCWMVTSRMKASAPIA